MQIEYRGFTKTNSANAEIIKTKDGFITGEWVYGYPLENKVEGKSYIIIVTANGGYNMTEVIPETLGQAVHVPYGPDLQDTKLYEGDFVNIDDGCVGSPYDRHPYWIVKFSECGFYAFPPDEPSAENPPLPLFNECAVYKVVGSLWNKPTAAGSEGAE